MTDVEIHYCVPCGHLDRAQDVQHAILSEYGQEIDRVALKTGDGGVFTVAVDSEQVFDVDEDEYDLDAIVGSVGEQR